MDLLGHNQATKMLSTNNFYPNRFAERSSQSSDFFLLCVTVICQNISTAKVLYYAVWNLVYLRMIIGFAKISKYCGHKIKSFLKLSSLYILDSLEYAIGVIKFT